MATHADRATQSRRPDQAWSDAGVAPPCAVLAFLFISLLLIGIAGVLYIQSVTVAAHKVAANNLSAVAQLKVREIVTWREERLSDGNVLMENPDLSEDVARWRADPGATNAEPLLTQFRSWQTHQHYRDVLLVDATGQVRLSLSGRRDRVHEEAATALAAALRDRSVVLTDLHAGPGDLPPHMDVVVPLAATNAQATEPRSAIILQVDAGEFLFPLIQTWPTASPSAETLLIRQEGNDVLYLNDLRHRKGTAMALRLPIGDKHPPAAQAVRGETGEMAGVDYRGVPVLAHVRAVPGTKWSMVAKVDQAEINAPLRRQVLLIGTCLGLLLLVIGLGVGLFWRQQRVRFHREKEESLRASELRYRRLFEAARDGVLILDAETGQVVDVNPFMIELLGYSREEFLGKKVWELGFFKDLVASEANFVELKAKGYIHYDDMALETSSGQRIEAEFFSHVYLVNDQKVIQCNVRDITEYKRRVEAARHDAQELHDKNIELERFLYTASHDLKSPVVTIRSFLGYLEQDMAAGDARRITKDLDFIRTATEKMAQLLAAVLEIARIGRIVGEPVNVTLRELADTALGTVAGRIAQREVTTQVDDRPVALCGDRLRLDEIWQNLVDNACKFMGDQKDPRIEIGVETRDAKTVFFVRDNGIGIDPRYQAKVFGLFEKLDHTAEGTGVGLALVKRIVEWYGGRIWVESKGAGQGTCFYFTLPGAVSPQSTVE